MKLRKSIRWRIQAWHGLLLLAVTVGFCVSAYRLEMTSALKQHDDAMELRLSLLGSELQRGGPQENGRDAVPGRRGAPARRATNRPAQPNNDRPGPPPGEGFDGDFGGEGDRPEPPRPPPPSRQQGNGSPPNFSTAQLQSLFDPAAADPYYFIVWRHDGSVMGQSSLVPSATPMPAEGATRGMARQVRMLNGARELFHFTPPGDCLLVGQSLAGFDRHMRDFALKVSAIGGGLLALGLAVGWWISSRALRPIADISNAAIRIANGNLKERIHTKETGSELGELAALLDRTFQRLDEVFEEQSRFTSDAAHELRTPVSVILAQSQLALARERTPEAYRETIVTTQRAAQRMHGLIESLLQLAELDAEGQLQLQPCDLAQVCRDHLPLLHTLAQEKGIALVEQFEPAPCRAQSEHLTQVLTNLVSNAVKYCPQGSTVHVCTGRKGDGVFLSVRDNGPGIEAEHLPHLFERFYRSDQSRSRATGGSGLGLAICQRIAEAHGGKLTVNSVVGAGTEFTLTMAGES